MNRLYQDHSRVRASPKGFTLVELMVSVTISLVLMLAMVAFLVNTSRTSNELARANSQIENGRFAIQVLQSDIALAGFWGNHIPEFDDLTLTVVPSDVPTEVPDPCLAIGSWDAAYKKNLIGIPLQTYEAAPASCATIVANQQTNTDILVIRHANVCVPGEPNCEADTSGKLYFQASACENEITATPALRYVLDTAGFTLKNRGCTGTPPSTVGVAASKRKFVSSIYYIRNYAVTSGDGIPTLVRSQFDLASGTLAHQTAEPLIEGIEAFRVELGIDDKSDTGAPVNFTEAVNWGDAAKTSPTNRGDGAPDNGAFIRCTTASPCTVAQLMNTVTARIHLLVRSREKTAGHTDTKTYTLAGATLSAFNDGYQRHVFSSTVRLTNVSGRRETP